MDTKKLVYMGLFVGSVAGSMIGGLFDKNSLIGTWGFVFGTIGALIGILAGYKIGTS